MMFHSNLDISSVSFSSSMRFALTSGESHLSLLQRLLLDFSNCFPIARRSSDLQQDLTTWRRRRRSCRPIADREIESCTVTDIEYDRPLFSCLRRCGRRVLQLLSMPTTMVTMHSLTKVRSRSSTRSASWRLERLQTTTRRGWHFISASKLLLRHSSSGTRRVVEPVGSPGTAHQCFRWLSSPLSCSRLWAYPISDTMPINSMLRPLADRRAMRLADDILWIDVATIWRLCGRALFNFYLLWRIAAVEFYAVKNGMRKPRSARRQVYSYRNIYLNKSYNVDYRSKETQLCIADRHLYDRLLFGSVVFWRLYTDSNILWITQINMPWR